MRNLLLSAILLTGATLFAPQVHAQSGQRGAIEGRVDRLEGEMRAVQRKVFPGGSGQYVQPDNQPADPQTILPGSPSSPVADLTMRVDSLETQLRGMIAQIEANQHKVQVLDARIKALEASAAAAPAPAPIEAGPIERPLPSKPPIDKPVVSKPIPSKAPAIATPKAGGATDPTRSATLAAVERPATGDIAEDTYPYGYRLWAAKLYPEAEAQFTTVTTKFSTHKRASYAQNLLGRSYLEEGKPSLASLAFYDNYKKWPDGDRAPESLFYLAQALVKLGKPAAQVCKVYTELTRSYGTKVEADARMKAGVAQGRADSSCS
jgi:TolA-binding protein